MFVQIACLKFGCLEEGTGVNLAFGTDATSRSRRTADIQSRQFVSKCVEVEERIGGQHIGVRLQPVGELAILLTSRMQVVPDILPTTRWTKARDTQLSIKTRGNIIETIQLIEAVTGQHTIHGQAQILCRQ